MIPNYGYLDQNFFLSGTLISNYKIGEIRYTAQIGGYVPCLFLALKRKFNFFSSACPICVAERDKKLNKKNMEFTINEEPTIITHAEILTGVNFFYILFKHTVLIMTTTCKPFLNLG
jgi:hypothetical protein